MSSLLMAALLVGIAPELAVSVGTVSRELSVSGTATGSDTRASGLVLLEGGVRYSLPAGLRASSTIGVGQLTVDLHVPLVANQRVFREWPLGTSFALRAGAGLGVGLDLAESSSSWMAVELGLGARFRSIELLWSPAFHARWAPRSARWPEGSSAAEWPRASRRCSCPCAWSRDPEALNPGLFASRLHSERRSVASPSGRETPWPDPPRPTIPAAPSSRRRGPSCSRAATRR